MASLTLLEKLSILLEVTKSSKLYIIVIIALIFLGTILITTNKMNAKSSRKLFVAIYLFFIVGAFILYRDDLLNMLDYLMNNLFVIIYFPNLAVYFAAILISSIILWVSVFNFKTPTIIKNINIVFYTVFNYLLIVLINIINEQKLDVFNTTSIYTNKSAQAIIELSSTLFIVWIIFLGLYKSIMIYQTRNYKVTTRLHTTNNIKVAKKEKKSLPKYVREIPAPKFVRTSPTLVKEVYTGTELQKFQNMFTLEDYKLLLSILTERREKEKKAEIRKIKEDKQYAKFRELKDLYGVR